MAASALQRINKIFKMLVIALLLTMSVSNDAVFPDYGPKKHASCVRYGTAAASWWGWVRLCLTCLTLLHVTVSMEGVMDTQRTWQKTKVMANEEEIVSMTIPPVEAEAQIRGDMIPEMTEAHGPEDQQVLVFPSVGTLEPTAASQTEAGDQNDGVAPEKVADNTVKANTDVPKVIEAETPAPMPARGDGPNNKPKLLPLDGVVCVGKEAIQDKNGVNLKLKAASNCENSKAKIESVLQELCDRDCKLEIFQEDNTDEIIVSGQYVEADVSGMTKKFNNDNIKIKTDVEEAAPRWERNSKLVLVSMLLSGLLLAAFLVSGYYLKTHRKNSKGVRLAESFQVDDENQANTLVSVAPLPQEPLDKPVVNGESPPENGNNPTPTTNGHSATQLPVADTEM